jgi:hypothetical protein
MEKIMKNNNNELNDDKMIDVQIVKQHLETCVKNNFSYDTIIPLAESISNLALDIINNSSIEKNRLHDTCLDINNNKAIYENTNNKLINKHKDINKTITYLKVGLFILGIINLILLGKLYF